jgi:hypothetical protein
MKKILLLIALTFSCQLWAGDNFKILEDADLNKYQKKTLMELKNNSIDKSKIKLSQLVEALDLSEEQIVKIKGFKQINREEVKEKIKTKSKSLNLTEEQKKQVKGLKRFIK